MNDEQFFQYTTDLYQAELAAPDRIFGRIPLVVSGIVIIGGIVGFLTTKEYLTPSGGLIVWLYYLSAAVAVSLLAAATFCIAASLKFGIYQRMKTAAYWDRWRRAYAEKVRESFDGYTKEDVDSIVAIALRDTMGSQMMALTERNQAVNERRFWWLRIAVGLTIMSLFPVGLEALCWIWLLLS